MALLPFCYANELPSEKDVEIFVTKLIDDYDDFIQIYEKNKVGFEEYKDKNLFSLYGGIGENFRVICVKVNENNIKSIAFLFERIQANDPLINIDYGDVINDYIRPLISFEGEGEYEVYLKNVSYDIPGDINKIEFAIVLPNKTIENNTETNAYYTAKWIYEKDKDDVRQYTINKIWKPFMKNEANQEIMNQSISLLLWASSISIKISNESYSYNDFLNDFKLINTTFSHCKDFPIMWGEWQQFSSYLNKINFCVECHDEINVTYHNISNNILNNWSYLYEDFKEDKETLNQSIQNIIKKEKEYSENLFHAIIFSAVIYIILLLFLYVVKIDTSYKKRIGFVEMQYILLILTTIFAIIVGVLSTLILDFNLVQILIVIVAFPLAYITYFVVSKLRHN